MASKIIKKLFTYLFATLFMGNAVATGDPVLVLLPVYSSTPEITANITSKLTAAGYSVTTHTGVPAGSLSSYKQIWDVRDPLFSNVRISSSDRNAYLTYLQGGGSLFIMGENTSCCNTRNTDIADMVSLAGGGTFGPFTNDGVTPQTVRSPFNSNPNVMTTVSYSGGGLVAANAMGSGSPITSNSSGGATAIYWGPGSLSSATAGTLITVLDINFISNSYSIFPLVENLIAYMAAPVPSTPTYTVGGTVTGLATGQAVVLLNNNGNSTTVNSNTSFTFSTAINSGSAYAVTVGTQPTA